MFAACVDSLLCSEVAGAKGTELCNVEVTKTVILGMVRELGNGGAQRGAGPALGVAFLCVSSTDGLLLPLQKHTEEITKMRNDFERQLRGQCLTRVLCETGPELVPSENSSPPGLVTMGLRKWAETAQICRQGTCWFPG